MSKAANVVRMNARAYLYAILLVVSAGSADVQAQVARMGPAPGWRTFFIPQFGTSLEYPASIFSVPAGSAEKGAGQRFTSADGGARLSVYSRANEAGETPATYLRNHLKRSRTALDYRRVGRSFFAISAVSQGTIYYSRCNFSEHPGGAIHCFDLDYPAHEKRAWDGVVTRISRSLRPLHG